MENKHLYFCDKCRTWLSGLPEEAEKGCPECHGSLTVIMPYEEWSRLSPNEKEKIKKQYMCGKSELARNRKSFSNESDKSIWITTMKVVSWVVFASFAIAAIFVSELLVSVSILAAVLSFLILLCIGCISVACSMIFLDMAQDVRTITSRMKK